VVNGLYFDAETDLTKDAIRGLDRISERVASNNRSRRLIRYPQHQVPTTFIRDSNAIFAQPIVREAVLGFFELYGLALGGYAPPKIDLSGGRSHAGR